MLVISQPRYLPALNYIQRIHFSKKFVLLDDVQRQARGWENRNQLLINGKRKWLTIPISSSKRALIKDSYIGGVEWIKQHKRTIKESYRNAPYFDENYVEQYYEGMQELIEDNNPFSKVIHKGIQNICDILEVSADIEFSSAMGENVNSSKAVNKLVEIAKYTQSNVYVSGPNGREYGVDEAFFGTGISVLYHKYNQLEYNQFNSETYEPYLGFFDALFNVGKEKLKEHIEEKPQFYEQ